MPPDGRWRRSHSLLRQTVQRRFEQRFSSTSHEHLSLVTPEGGYHSPQAVPGSCVEVELVDWSPDDPPLKQEDVKRAACVRCSECASPHLFGTVHLFFWPSALCDENQRPVGVKGASSTARTHAETATARNSKCDCTLTQTGGGLACA
jgi:hypothetical protein